MQVLRAAPATAHAGSATHQLREELPRASAVSEKVSVAAMVRDDDVIITEAREHADGICLLADAGVGRTREDAGREAIEHELLEPPDEQQITEVLGVAHPRHTVIPATPGRRARRCRPARPC